jgi:hypothetical protein
MSQQRDFPELRSMNIDAFDDGSTVVKRDDNPKAGFDLELSYGRVKIGFNLLEAKRLGFFIACLLNSADKEVKKDDKEGKITISYEKESPLTPEKMPSEDSGGQFPLGKQPDVPSK